MHPMKTFQKWLQKVNREKIHKHAHSKYKQLRQNKCPEPDDMAMEYIQETENYLSEHRIGLSWSKLKQVH